jgi:hypothetical protein
MADNYIGYEALDAQLRWIADKATRVAIVSSYSRGDTYADILPRILVYHHVNDAPLWGDIFSEITRSGADVNAPNRVLPYLGSPETVTISSSIPGSDQAIVVLQDNQQRILFTLNDRYNVRVTEGESVFIQPFKFMAAQQVTVQVPI